MTSPIFVDMRSDIYSKPTQGMRDAMANADVTDDPLLYELQERCAALLGKERAMFVPTATMGNLISVMSHCHENASQIIIGSKSHIGCSESGHFSRVAGTFPRMVTETEDGTFDLSDLTDIILNGSDTNVCTTRLICLENTHNKCGGKILPLDYLHKVYSLAQENNIKVHVDGARLMNAAVGLGVDVKEITQYFDSITFCLNKGLGAPIGSIVAGSASFIQRAWENRKTVGGEMNQLGMIAAAALYGLDRAQENLNRDHILAKRLANGLQNPPFSDSTRVSVDAEQVQTNIVFLRTHRDHSFVRELFKRLMVTTESELKELGKEIHVGSKILDKNIRLIIHQSLTEQDINDVITKVNYVLRIYNQ
ncbi:probable low-specificity L-threonine aldolase 2 [Argonauta hians]